MVPPPWKLLSPTGVLYFVPTRAALAWLSNEKGLSGPNMLVLVGESTGNLSAGSKKSHEGHWVRFTDVKWIRRDGCHELVYTLGATWGRGSAQLVIDVLAKGRGDMPFTSREMVDKLLNGKKDHGRVVEHHHQWRLQPKPADAEERMPRVFVPAVPPPPGTQLPVVHPTVSPTMLPRPQATSTAPVQVRCSCPLLLTQAYALIDAFPREACRICVAALWLDP